MFAVVLGVSTIGWEWRMEFVNQGDTATTTSDEDFYELGRNLYVCDNPHHRPGELTHIDLGPLLAFCGCDGGGTVVVITNYLKASKQQKAKARALLPIYGGTPALYSHWPSTVVTTWGI